MITETIFKPLELLDRFLATTAMRARYLKLIQEGRSHEEAMRKADQFGREVMGDRTRGTKPLAFHAKNPLSQMMNLFQLEAMNSWEHLSQDLPRDFREIERTHGKSAAAGRWAGCWRPPCSAHSS